VGYCGAEISGGARNASAEVRASAWGKGQRHHGSGDPAHDQAYRKAGTRIIRLARVHCHAICCHVSCCSVICCAVVSHASTLARRRRQRCSQQDERVAQEAPLNAVQKESSGMAVVNRHTSTSRPAASTPRTRVLAIVKREGVMLESGRGPIPNLVEFIAGSPRVEWRGRSRYVGEACQPSSPPPF
jgi:hypothetical protein